MFWQLAYGKEYQPKWYLNGFPKAGLHLLDQMVMSISKPVPPAFTHGGHWAGTYKFNSWTNQPKDIEYVLRGVSRLQPGTFVKGHAGWSLDFQDFAFYLGVAMVFIYRDLRDVAVSQAHHILSTDDVNFRHPAKATYRALGGFDEVLKAVIEGLGPFPGITERWELFAPWLEVGWVHKVKFEELLEEREKHAVEMLNYALHRTVDVYDMGLKADTDLFGTVAQRMVDASKNPHMSPTFRKGKTGGWKDAFTDEHKELFKMLDNGWLVRLGYEEDDSW